MRCTLVLSFMAIGLLQGCVAPVVAASAGTDKVMTASDRRSAGAKIEDDTIESSALKGIEEKYKDGVDASVTAFNSFVLVTGTVPNESTKMGIERVIGTVPNVKGIANELVVGDAASMDTTGTDTQLAANINIRFARSTAFKAIHVKVVTKNSVVYLMGLVTRAEADAASDIASTTAGVQKVVRVFEYID
jgi:osmotically-inducible protein OsmY